jgi:hypothetical protein
MHQDSINQVILSLFIQGIAGGAGEIPHRMHQDSVNQVILSSLIQGTAGGPGEILCRMHQDSVNQVISSTFIQGTAGGAGEILRTNPFSFKECQIRKMDQYDNENDNYEGDNQYAPRRRARVNYYQCIAFDIRQVKHRLSSVNATKHKFTTHFNVYSF